MVAPLSKSKPAPRTLIISPNWIGDAVISQTLLRQLKTWRPERAIDVLAPKWVAPMWRMVREVDAIIETPFTHGPLQLGERWKFANRLKSRGYVDAYVLPNTFKSALIPWMAGIPRRVGYRGEMRYGLINVMHHVSPQAPRPMVSFYAALAQPPAPAAPLPNELPRPTLTVPPEQAQQVEAKFGLDRSKRLLVMAPGAEFGEAKRWPAAHFAELARVARQTYPDIQIVLLGSGKDKPVCDQIIAAVPHAQNLAGVTSLEQAIAVIAQADAVVSNDSGLMNIASALNRPIVAIYGPTDWNNTPPFSEVAEIMSLHLECAPCHQRTCPLGHHNCMKLLTADMVWQPLRPMLERK
ncbi:MAG: lipopolysaccharide heptosyltransferase II [Burkholderiales bacterium]|nr:lipopolysaccharide heptosyltransferase II [Burkholderiales bacterium]